MSPLFNYRGIDNLQRRNEIFQKLGVTTAGKYVNYSNCHGDVKTKGRVFVYDRINSSCYPWFVSNKYLPACSNGSFQVENLRQLLIVACQRSGTHEISRNLNNIGLDVRHEGIGVHGAVSWPYAVRNTDVKLAYIINNKENLRNQRFRFVMHQVRHPINVIRTLVARASKYDVYWNWISRIYFCSEINRTQTALRRSMIYYLCWNEHIERYADIRYQMESTSFRDICKWAKFSNEICSSNFSSRPLSAKYLLNLPWLNAMDSSFSDDNSSQNEERHLGDFMKRKKAAQALKLKKNKEYNESIRYGYNITWTDLDKEDLQLSNKIRLKCLQYEYSL